MEFAFLDESGDSGAKGSKHLLLTLVIVRKRRNIEKIISNYKKQLKRTKKGRKWLLKTGGEIKFYGFPDKKLLKKLVEELALGMEHIYSMAFVKNEHKMFFGEKAVILGHVINHYYKKASLLPTDIIADLGFISQKGIKYYKVLKYQKVGVENKKNEIDISLSLISAKEYKKEIVERKNNVIKVKHINSRTSPILQAVDILSGAIFSNKEKLENKYIQKIPSEKHSHTTLKRIK